MIIVAYIGTLIVGAIILYTVCRAVDHFFIVREEGVKTGYKAELIGTACDDIKWLTDDMLKNINDQVQNMFKGEV